MFAVTVVPIFSPNIIAAAIGKSIHPWNNMTRVIAVEADEDWVTSVNKVPAKTNSKIDRNPNSVN